MLKDSHQIIKKLCLAIVDIFVVVGMHRAGNSKQVRDIGVAVFFELRFAILLLHYVNGFRFLLFNKLHLLEKYVLFKTAQILSVHQPF